MDSKGCSAANAAVQRVRKLVVLRLNSNCHGVSKLHRKERARKPIMLPFAGVHATDPLVNERPHRAGDEGSPLAAAALRPDGSPARARQPSRRQQQQELLWSSFGSDSQQQHSVEPALSSLQPLDNQEHEKRGGRRGAGVSEGVNVTATGSGDPEGDVVPADLLAQRDAALLMRGGRHRNRRPVSTPPPQPQPPLLSGATPAFADEVPPAARDEGEGDTSVGGELVLISGQGDSGDATSIGGDGCNGDDDGGREHRLSSNDPQNMAPPGLPVPPVEAGSAGLLSGGTATATNPRDGEPAAAAGGVGGGGGVDGASGGGASRGGHVVLRLRRRQGPEAQAPRRIRLPLPQRPHPWPVKLLLEAQQREQQQQQQGGQEQQGQELRGWDQGEAGQAGEQLQQLLGRDEGGAVGLLGLPVALPPWQEQRPEEARKRRGRQEGAQTQQQQAQQGQKQEQKQEKQKQQKHERQASASTARGGAAVGLGSPGGLKVHSNRRVLSHPDGTLWSYRTRDVGPLAARVLQQLKQATPPLQPPPPQQPPPAQDQKGDRGAGLPQAGPTQQVTVASRPRSGDGAEGSGLSRSSTDSVTGSSSGGGGSTDESGGVGGGSGMCHVLAAGSYQAYSLLRALSYVQGALRLASYNRPLYTSAVGAPPPTPALGFTASFVSLPELRAYFQETVRHSSGARPELGPPPSASRQRPSPPPSLRSPPPPHAPPIVAGPPPPPTPKAPKDWPADDSFLDPRALVSVFLIQPPPQGMTARGAAAPGSEPPPITVTARADAAVLTRLLTARLHFHGTALVQALGREASSLAMYVLTAAAVQLAERGLGAVALPRMEALRPQRPRAPPSPPPLGRKQKSNAAAVAAGRGRRPSSVATGAEMAEAAAAAFDPVLLDAAPQLVIQVVLCEWDEAGRPLVTERWRPGTQEAAAAATAAAETAGSADATELFPDSAETAAMSGRFVGVGPEAPPVPTYGSTTASQAADGPGAWNGAGAGRRTAWAPLPHAEPPPRQPASTAPTGGAAATVAAAAPWPSVRLLPIPLAGPGGATAAAARAARCDVRLGPEGCPDTRSAAAAVAQALAEGRPVALSARGLGSLLRLPVVLFRAQGQLRRAEGRVRTAVLVFTLRAVAGDSGSIGGGTGGVGEAPDRVRTGQQLQPPLPQQQQSPHPEPRLAAEGPAGAAAAAAAAAAQQSPVRADEAGGEGDSVVAEVWWLPASALQSHLDSLPGPPPPKPIATRSSSHRLLPASSAATHGCEDDDASWHDAFDHDSGRNGDGDGDSDQGGGAGDNGDGGSDQRHVQEAAAAAVEQLLRYGTATLEGSSPGRRLTALLAAGAVSEGLRCSARLTVLMRLVAVDGGKRAPPPPIRQRQQHSDVPRQGRGRQLDGEEGDGGSMEPSAPWRPPPPRRYQLLLARMDPRVGRLQLLTPEDLVASSAKSAAVAAAQVQRSPQVLGGSTAGGRPGSLAD